MHNRRFCAIRLLTAFAAGAAPAMAQKSDPSRLAELAALDARLASSTAAIAAGDAQAVLEKLDGWRFDPASLTAAQRAQLLRCFTLATLATGDAFSSRAYFNDLLAQQPDDPVTHAIGRLVALAAADGKLATSMLSRQKTVADAERKEAIGEQLRRARHIGRRCPDVRLDLSPSELVELPGKPGVIVLELWNPRKKPDDPQLAAMRARFAEYQPRSVRFYGVVAAGPQADEARALARSANLNWPHVFEAKATGAPLTHKTFQATAAPMTIIVDADGIIRAVAQPDDPALDYALRAVVAEADGTFRAPDPRPAEGKPPLRGELRPERSAAGAVPKSPGAGTGERKAEPGKPPAELRHDDQADSKLREGRLALKTGQRRRAKEIFQAIVRDYPGTTAASQAEEYLSSLP